MCYSTTHQLLEIPFHNLTTTGYSPKLLGIQVYNKLPDSIKKLTNKKFEQLVKHLLISK